MVSNGTAVVTSPLEWSGRNVSGPWSWSCLLSWSWWALRDRLRILAGRLRGAVPPLPPCRICRCTQHWLHPAPSMIEKSLAAPPPPAFSNGLWAIWSPRHHRQEHLGRRRAVAQRGVRPLRVVVAAPLLNQDPGLCQGVEHLGIEQLSRELAIEAFHTAILPRAAGLDECCLGPDTVDPSLDSFGYEIWSVVWSDVDRHAPSDEHVGAERRSRPPEFGSQCRMKLM
jgi:hypothetical protein